jgi:hypothetical protein
MRNLSIIVLTILITSCSTSVVKKSTQTPAVKYEVDLTKHNDDLFHVKVFVENLSPENNIYNFAATAPGTYQILNFGRFIKSFKAFDEKGEEIQVKRISENKWEITDPEKLDFLDYDMEDSFDAMVNEFPVSPMCGS